MNFDFDDDHRELQQAARTLLADRCPLSQVREIFEGPAPYDRALWSAGADMGWMGLTVPERHGGLGLGHLELALLAEELGRSLAPLPFSSSVYLATEAILLAGSAEQRERYLPRLASGDLIATLAHQERRDRVGGAGIETRLDGGRIDGAKAPVPDCDVAGLAVVVANGGSSLALVELDGEGVTREALTSLDPSRPLGRLRFDGARAECLGGDGDGQELLGRLYDRAAVLFAFEQIGGAQRCLDLAVGYAKERHTFGRPIGSYQAIKHKLADVFVAIELARSNAYYGAWALSNDSDELAVAACLARISATEAFQMAAEEGLHVHGGIGFTWEHDAHLFLRRSRLLALVLGANRRWKRMLVQRLVARGPAGTLRER